MMWCQRNAGLSVLIELSILKWQMILKYWCLRCENHIHSRLNKYFSFDLRIKNFPHTTRYVERNMHYHLNLNHTAIDLKLKKILLYGVQCSTVLCAMLYSLSWRLVATFVARCITIPFFSFISVVAVFTAHARDSIDLRHRHCLIKYIYLYLLI